MSADEPARVGVITRDDVVAFMRQAWQDPCMFHEAIAAHFGIEEDEYVPASLGGVLVEIAGALDAYEKWMVRSNLARISAGETSAEVAVATLQANGYPRIAHAVEAFSRVARD